MTIALIEAPLMEPINLVEAKQHLRVDHDDEDQLILDLIVAARELVEFQTGQKLMVQKWRQYEDCPDLTKPIELLLRPILSISAVTLYQEDGTPTTLSSDHYKTNVSFKRLKILAPHHLYNRSNGIEIDLNVGMAQTGNEVPSSLKRAILLLVAHWYEFRGAVSPSQQPVSIPHGFEVLISPYKRVKL